MRRSRGSDREEPTGEQTRWRPTRDPNWWQNQVSPERQGGKGRGGDAYFASSPYSAVLKSADVEILDAILCASSYDRAPCVRDDTKKHKLWTMLSAILERWVSTTSTTNAP